MLFLKEELSPSESKLVESMTTGKDTYLSGILMQSDKKNRNNRVYPLSEITKAVDYCQKQIKEGNFVVGELNHPDNLSIDLKNVSHVITEIWMEGKDAVGKCKILNTPMGQIAKGLLDGGVRLGVSSRGTGNVTNEGYVSDFNFVTIDIVATPSAPDAYPKMVREHVEDNPHVLSLAEAVMHDPIAQKYFEKEMKVFMQTLFKSK